MSAPERPAPWSPPSPYPAPRRTARLLLRFWAPEDAPSFLAALNIERDSFLPWLPWVADDNRNLAEVMFNFERFRRERERTAPPPGDFTLGVIDAATGQAVGGTGFARLAHAHHEAEIGYWIRADRRGHGLCPEATAAMISWGLTPQSEGGWGFHRVHIRVAGSNAVSRRVPEKLGLRHEACLRSERWVNSIGWDDTHVWGVVAGEWDTTNDRLG
jgi:ribosomal-protein-serine acetyltransferase